jgi:hypothetical protein
MLRSVFAARASGDGTLGRGEAGDGERNERARRAGADRHRPAGRAALPRCRARSIVLPEIPRIRVADDGMIVGNNDLRSQSPMASCPGLNTSQLHV